MANASVFAGADGLMVEVHFDPDKALSDGAQSLTIEQFAALMDNLKQVTQCYRGLKQYECLVKA
jgi:3-deoxy-7-phosphoheptulonate synthase